MDTTQPANTATAPRRLTRSTDDRVLGGVAGGLGRYFNVDPVIFRIAFVVLAVMGGGGIALYLIGWLLVPEEGHERSLASAALGSHDLGRWARIGVWVLIGIAVIAAFSSGWWWGPGWGGADHVFGHLLGGIVIGGAVLAALWLLFRGRRWSLRHWLAASVLAIVVLTVVVSGAALATVALTSDAPLRGGIGDRAWRPTTVDEVRHAYHLAAGDLLVDLRAITPKEPLKVRATVGFGRVTVLVPPTVPVGVQAHSGVGEVATFGSSDGGVGVDRARRFGGPTAPRLLLDVEAGMGQVDIRAA